MSHKILRMLKYSPSISHLNYSIYVAGCQPQLKKFYPQVNFPVSDKAANISSLVKWDHSISWLTPKLKVKESFGEFVLVNIHEEEWSYLKGHEIDGRIIMPATSYLVRIVFRT